MKTPFLFLVPMFKTSLPTREHCSLLDLLLKWSRLLLSVCILVFRWEESVKSSWNWFCDKHQCLTNVVVLFHWRGKVVLFCFCFCFWCRNDSSLLLLFHCLPHCNSYLTCLVIPEFPKRPHWACDSTVSAWLVRREDASVSPEVDKRDSGCAGSMTWDPQHPRRWENQACVRNSAWTQKTTKFPRFLNHVNVYLSWV